MFPHSFVSYCFVIVVCLWDARKALICTIYSNDHIELIKLGQNNNYLMNIIQNSLCNVLRQPATEIVLLSGYDFKGNSKAYFPWENAIVHIETIEAAGNRSEAVWMAKLRVSALGLRPQSPFPRTPQWPYARLRLHGVIGHHLLFCTSEQINIY